MTEGGSGERARRVDQQDEEDEEDEDEEKEEEKEEGGGGGVDKQGYSAHLASFLCALWSRRKCVQIVALNQHLLRMACVGRGRGRGVLRRVRRQVIGVE
jgi:hypothetical protein